MFIFGPQFPPLSFACCVCLFCSHLWDMLLGPTFCIVYIFVCLKFVNLVCKVFYLCLFVLLFVLLIIYLYLWLVWKLVVCWWSDRSIKLDSVLSEGWFQSEDCFSAAAQFFTLPSHDGCILRWGEGNFSAVFKFQEVLPMLDRGAQIWHWLAIFRRSVVQYCIALKYSLEYFCMYAPFNTFFTTFSAREHSKF